MHPWHGLAAVLAWNLHRHRHDRSTLCSAARSRVPAPVLIGGWYALTVWIVDHLLGGYARDRAAR